jgi:CheY-like chemotaxis protein
MEREDAGHALRGVYILLVDDNPAHRDAMREILRYCGAWVREVATSDEALSVLRETTPTALVIVVRFPGDAAWTLVRALRAMPPEHGGKMPVVGVGPAGLAVEARAHGFDAYLTEPIEAWALCRAVGELTE